MKLPRPAVVVMELPANAMVALLLLVLLLPVAATAMPLAVALAAAAAAAAAAATAAAELFRYRPVKRASRLVVASREASAGMRTGGRGRNTSAIWAHVACAHVRMWLCMWMHSSYH